MVKLACTDDKESVSDGSETAQTSIGVDQMVRIWLKRYPRVASVDGSLAGRTHIVWLDIQLTAASQSLQLTPTTPINMFASNLHCDSCASPLDYGSAHSIHMTLSHKVSRPDEPQCPQPNYGAAPDTFPSIALRRLPNSLQRPARGLPVSQSMLPLTLVE